MTNLNNNLIVDGIKTLLDVSPLYGNIVMNLARDDDEKALTALQLRWQAHRWFLIVNPTRFNRQFSNHNQVALALAHEALHIVWAHPTRYAFDRKQRRQLVNLGTGIAVNQYLPSHLGDLPEAITLQTILGIYGKLLPPYQDSAQYIAQLAELDDKLLPQYAGNYSGHEEWQSAGVSLDEAEAALETVIRQAQKDAQRSGRGQLPGSIQQRIDEIMVPKRHWRAILRAGLSAIPNRRKTTRARFNRRQAYRLDLPGELSTYALQLIIFVDNSASISNHQVSMMLAQVAQIAKQFDANIQIFSFDTSVHVVKRIKQWVRHAGGGTSFQCIFDMLAAKHYEPMRTVIVILTDGDGEHAALSTNFHQVYWLLPRGKRLSIKQPFGKMIPIDLA
ncbi:vWA domain-containing protein [Leuconostoc citreum]|uniref:vWA domain-containing protein n=1 Tax=Leuconostoc citreum TaxID=33964 RepID=UPI00186B625D|nr:VWA-like domain-containing protein [Leuconostoc citreum]MBE4726533.1 peptidase [Leuconostoc citreum]